MPEAAGEGQFGEFRIVREIGRGGMGVVYLAEQPALRRMIALKVLPAHLTLREESVERFRREAATAARLRHRGIVEIFAVGETAGSHWFAMELIDGLSLDRIITEMRREDAGPPDASRFELAVSGLEATTSARTNSDGAMPASATAERAVGEDPDDGRPRSSAANRSHIATVCRLIAAVAEALEHAHKAGVIHRDVKPANILVRKDGTPVLTDFGLAREESLPALTHTGDFAGTPYYVSPEQAMAGRARVDQRTDVFSLGVTLFELLTLKRPFDGNSVQEVLGRIIAKEPTHPRRLNPLLPRDLATIVLTAIEKDPDRRYQSADALARDLRAFLDFRPISARPPSLGMRAVKLVRRHRLVAAAIALALLAIVGTSTWWYYQPAGIEIRLRGRLDHAVIYVDDLPYWALDYASGHLRFDVRPGFRRIRIDQVDGDLEMRETTIYAARVWTLMVEGRISSKSGLVRLESTPPGAKVVLMPVVPGGAESRPTVDVPGTTPALIPARAGDYIARFSLAGFETADVAVSVDSGGVQVTCRQAWASRPSSRPASRSGG